MIGLADLVDLVDVDDSALGGFDIEVGGLKQLEQDVLDVLADITGLGQGRGVADGERHVQNPGQGPGQQGLAAAGGADQKDVRLVEFDVGPWFLAVNQPLVVVVNGDGQNLLGPLLADHVLIKLFLDLSRRGDVGEQRLGDASPPAFLVEDRLAKLDAFAADVDVSRPFDQRADVAIAFPAERAIGVFSWSAASATRRGRARAAAAGGSAAAVVGPSTSAAGSAARAPRDVLTRRHVSRPFRPS